MNRFINPYNPVMNFIGKLLDCIILNLLWFLCSIPVFTLGASTSALYYCTLKLAEDTRVSVCSDFFHAFRRNFREGTRLTGILLPVAAVFFFSGQYYQQRLLPGVLFAVGAGLYLLFLILFLIILLYVFPLLARFDNNWKAMLKNAFLIGIRYPLCTLLIAGIHILLAFLAVRFYTPLVFLGEGFAAFLCSYLLKPIFHTLAGTTDKNTDSSESSVTDTGTEPVTGIGTEKTDVPGKAAR